MPQTRTKDEARLGEIGDPLGIVQEIEIWPYKWFMYKPESVLMNETHEILWDFEIQTDHLILARRPDLALINNK